MASRFLRYCIFGLTALALVTTSSYSQGKGQGKGKGHQEQDDDDDDNSREHGKPGFGRHDRGIIIEYYSHRGSNLPPGLAKRHGNLPPGLEKHLERNGTLPPGLQKRLQPFPEDLERRLPPLPPDYRRGTIGAHVVIFNRRTQVIVDVLKDVAR